MSKAAYKIETVSNHFQKARLSHCTKYRYDLGSVKFIFIDFGSDSMLHKSYRSGWLRGNQCQILGV